jgi:hypothetical protein
MGTRTGTGTVTYILVKRAISVAETDGLVFFSTRRRCSLRISCYRSGGKMIKYMLENLRCRTAEQGAQILRDVPLDDPPQLQHRRSNQTLVNRDAVKKPRSGATTKRKKKKTKNPAKVSLEIFFLLSGLFFFLPDAARPSALRAT